MAGLNIILSNEGSQFTRLNIEEIQNELNYLDNFRAESHIHDSKTFIGWNKYEEYPVNDLSYKHYLILLEGKVYNTNPGQLKDKLPDIIKSIEEENYEFTGRLMKELDGDFIFYIFDRAKLKLYVLNDIFGRIPLYYHNTRDGVIVSRHLRFITALTKDSKFDRISLAEFLLMGFMTGSRTLLKNTRQVGPASLLVASADRAEIIRLYHFNFENKVHSGINFEENIQNITDLFSTAVKNRLEGSTKNIMTLSGGLDSRAVASSMYFNGIPFTTVGMDYTSGHEKKDLSIAKQLAEMFSSAWETVTVTPPTGKDLAELLKLKEGMNTLATAGILSFYRGLIEKYGNDINYITGDNGDKLIFTIDKPVKQTESIEELIEYTIEDRTIIPIEIVTNILGVHKDDILADLNDVFVSYPEKSLVQKFIHFRIIEKPFKYAFQGEDRHRNYFWNVTPFWSFPFFDYLMNCPDEMKKRHRTFRSWLQNYSDKAVRLTYTNFRSSIASPRGRLFMLMIYYFYPRLTPGLKKLAKVSFFSGNSVIPDNSPLMELLITQTGAESVREYFGGMKSSDIKSGRKVDLYNIVTLTSAVEFLRTGSTTIDQFAEKVFEN